MVGIYNKLSHIKLTTLTPIHIGAGGDVDWIRGIDYIENGDNIYLLDMQKVAELVGAGELSSVLAEGNIDTDSQLLQLIGDNLDNVLRCKPFKRPFFISKGEKTYISSSAPIKSFIRNQLLKVPIIPGTSMKGAIRSILFKHLRDGESDLTKVFGEFNDGVDFMRFIQIGDAAIEKADTTILNTKIFNLHKEAHNWIGGWKHKGGKYGQTDSRYRSTGFNTLYECVGIGANADFNITLKGNAMEMIEAYIERLKWEGKNRLPRLPYANEKKLLLNSGIVTLFGIINSHTRQYLDKEIIFFQAYPVKRSEEFVNSLQSLYNMIPVESESNVCILRISAGSGYHAITGDWYIYSEDHVNNGEWRDIDEMKRMNVSKNSINCHRYKSRKVVECNGRILPMGFVKLTAL